MTSKFGPTLNELKMYSGHNHRYSNEANWDIYDDFKLKTTFDLHALYKNISAL